MENNKDNMKETKDNSSGRGSFYLYVFLKTEKLTSALYMVTEFITDSDPLKWKLRTLALDLLSEAGAVKDKTEYFGAAGLSRLVARLRDIISLLSIAYSSRSVSQMNCEILEREYAALAEQIEERAGKESFGTYLSGPRVSEYQTISLPTTSLPAAKEPVRYQNNFSAAGPFAKGAPRSIGQKDIKKDSQADYYGLNNREGKKNIRKEQIISWLKDKPWTNISEIANALPDCGIKTVQRELLDMVATGILKKQGERRWSRYMLA